MTVRLRPHHLLCLLTYVGKGYSPAFTANMTVIAQRLAIGETVEIVDGPDDICAPLLTEMEPHCHGASVTDRDLRAAQDIGRMLDTLVRPGSKLILNAPLAGRLRTAFATRRIRSACAGCDWDELCGTISANGYDGTIL
ncbi:MAG: DUF1284 domain-containing protein [Paracoccus sp. (in: a-proteobacteria)]|uniref:DUF1284 domain-containing protein n=1 Tax=Paracoccus sp. TaxID=267 RepID=UPI0039E729B5